jgi:hypothetical protein
MFHSSLISMLLLCYLFELDAFTQKQNLTYHCEKEVHNDKMHSPLQNKHDNLQILKCYIRDAPVCAALQNIDPTVINLLMN